MFFTLGFACRVAKQSYHLLEHAELDELGSDSEPDGAPQKHDDEDVCPEDVVDGGYPLSHCFHILFFVEFEIKLMSLKNGCYQSKAYKVGQEIARRLPACLASFTTLIESEKFVLLQDV